MNAVFDLHRWSLYIGKHWSENKRRYLLSLAAVGGLLVLWYSFIMIVQPHGPLGKPMQGTTYFVGLFITGCLFASLIFNDLSEGPKAIHYLLTPTSALEKLLTAILFGVILFFISYTILFYAIDFIMIKVSNGLIAAWLEREHKAPRQVQEVLNVFVTEKEDQLHYYLLLFFFEIQSIFLLGSVYFVKNQYIKTLVSGLVVFLLLVFFVHKVMGSFMPDGGFFEPFTVYRVFNKEGDTMVLLPEWFSDIILFLTKYALAPALWVVAYFRLKEKEV